MLGRQHESYGPDELQDLRGDRDRGQVAVEQVGCEAPSKIEQTIKTTTKSKTKLLEKML